MSLESQNNLNLLSADVSAKADPQLQSLARPEFVSFEELKLLALEVELLSNYTLFSGKELRDLEKKISTILGLETVKLNPKHYDHSIYDKIVAIENFEIANDEFQKCRQLLSTFSNYVEEDELYIECVQAYNQNDQAALKDLIPEVFKVKCVNSYKPLLHGVTFQKTDSIETYVARILKIREEGILPTPYGKDLHGGMDSRLRPIYGAIYSPEETHGIVYFEMSDSIGNLFSTTGSELEEEACLYTPLYKAQMTIKMRPDLASVLGDDSGEVTSEIWQGVQDQLIASGIDLTA